jgi:hypothetical protein
MTTTRLWSLSLKGTNPVPAANVHGNIQGAGLAITKQSVDATVQAAIENLQAGRGVEDDSIELKAEWPDPATKVRQFAGAANALRGDPLIYVIGVHDKTGAITTPVPVEPKEWYDQICKPFDQIPPSLLWSQTVFVGHDSKSVTVMVFGTDEFPYLINVEKARREVPLRIGTGTQSARRNQLVRMFEPALRTPSTFFTVAKFRAVVHEVTKEDRVGNVRASDFTEASITLWLDARVLIEHLASSPLVIPVRDIRLRIRCRDLETRLQPRVQHLGDGAFWGAGDTQKPDSTAPQFGVYAQNGQVIATAPGEVVMESSARLGPKRTPDSLHTELFEMFSRENECEVDIFMRAIGSARPITVQAALQRTTAPGPVSVTEGKVGPSMEQRLGEWEFIPVDFDPWG